MAKKNTTHWTFPRTMTRGALAGQTFNSQADYSAALREARGGRRRRRPAAQPSVRTIVEAYEELRTEGIGQAKAARLVERLVLGR